MTYVLITGAKGFIGQNLARTLCASGSKVVGLGHGAIPPTQLVRYGLTDWLNGDVDHTNLQWVARRHGSPDAIFHLAGGSNVGRSLENPLEDFSRTVVTAGNLFEWIRLECERAATTIVSSAAVYGQGHTGPIPEDSPLNPFSPYGAHKAMMEQLAKSYAENYGLKIAVCRLFSVYGPGLEKQLVYDLCVKCQLATLRRDSTLELFGSGDELRDWIHVTDVCHLLNLVKEQAAPSCPIYNGGSGHGVSVRQVANHVSQVFSSDIKLTFNGKVRSGDPTSLIAEVNRSAAFGFKPSVSLNEGIEQVVTEFLRSESSS